MIIWKRFITALKNWSIIWQRFWAAVFTAFMLSIGIISWVIWMVKG
jgi:hypothetical protein